MATSTEHAQDKDAIENAPRGSGGAPPESPRANDTIWSRASTFWASAVLLLILMLALIPAMSNGHTAVPDDGVYAAQARLLAARSWSEARPAAAIDADGVNSTIGPSFIYADRQVPYLRHPLFPIVLGGLYWLGGFGAMLVFSTTGAWLAAIAAGLMARRLDLRYGVPALALTAIGSPLIFDAYIVSAHAMATAMCGFAALGVARIVDGQRRTGLALSLPCAVLAVFLRTEAVVAMIAITGVVALLSLHPRQRPRVELQGLIAALSIGAVSALAYLVDSYWTLALKTSFDSGPQPLFRELIEARDPVSAAWISLLRPWYGDGRDAQAALVLGVVAILLSAVALKVAPRRWLLSVALLVLGAGCLAYQVLAGVTLATGFIATFPVAVGGIILLSRQALRRPMVVRNLGISVVAVIGITITSYGIGGANEWGGRFYHLLIPLLVPIAVLGLDNGRVMMPRLPSQVAASAAVVGTVAISLIGLGYIRGARDVSQQAVDAARGFAMDHVPAHDAPPTRRPLVIVGMLQGDGTGRIFWEPTPDVDVISAIGIGDLFTVIDRARQHGYPSVSVITNISPTVLSIVGDKRLEGTGWELGDLEPVSGTQFGVVEFGPPHDNG